MLSEEEKSRRVELQGAYWNSLCNHELLLRKKTRVRWINEGDGNTKFFHSFVNWRGGELL